jgi:hypothetical protein
MQRGPLSTKWAQQRGGHAQEIFQKLPQTSPNFLKIVENISCHQNNYFQSIKTCFKIFWSNAKRGGTEYLGLSKGGTTDRVPKLREGETAGNFSKIQKSPQTSPNFLKIIEKISFHQNNYF